MNCLYQHAFLCIVVLMSFSTLRTMDNPKNLDRQPQPSSQYPADPSVQQQEYQAWTFLTAPINNAEAPKRKSTQQLSHQDPKKQKTE